MEYLEPINVNDEGFELSSQVSSIKVHFDKATGKWSVHQTWDAEDGEDYDFASEEEVVNYILRERQVELAGEGRRWFDLLRTGKWKEVMKPINGMEQDGNELFPIHYSHILENPKIVQNTYYGNTNN